MSDMANTGTCGVNITDTIIIDALMACITVTLKARAVQIGVDINGRTTTIDDERGTSH